MNSRIAIRTGTGFLASGSLVSLLIGCTVMPAFGPSSDSIVQSASMAAPKAQVEETVPYELVELNQSTIPTAIESTRFFSPELRVSTFKLSDQIIGSGDELEIRIWEVAEDGLFSGAGRKETALSVSVSNSGHITVPYAGTVEAAGATTSQLRDVLLERYRGRAVEPEITVTVTKTDSQSVSILGAVGAPGRVDVPAHGIRLTDLLAQVGGTAGVPWEIGIDVQRNERSSSVRLSDVFGAVSNNIVILPSDLINVQMLPRRFAVYGAVNRPGNIEVSSLSATLSDVLAQAGGLNDRVAEAQSIFVFRPKENSGLGSTEATAFRLDFSKPDALLIAARFTMNPDDLVYVSSADAADFQRFVALVLSPLFGSITSAQSLGN